MTTKDIKLTSILSLAIGVFLLCAFASAGILTRCERFYSGDPKPANQVAFVYQITGHIKIDEVCGISLFGFRDLVGLELLPGYYDFCLSYQERKKEATHYIDITTEQCVSRRVKLEPGHIYCFASDSKDKHFSPFLWDITQPADCLKLEQAMGWKNGYLGGSLSDIDRYFRGKRPESKAAKGVVAKAVLETETVAYDPVWKQLQAGNVLEVTFENQPLVIVVEKLTEDCIIYHDIGNPGPTFVLHRGQVKKLAILADSEGDYKKKDP